MMLATSMKKRLILSSVVFTAALFLSSFWLHGSKDHIILSVFSGILSGVLSLLVWISKRGFKNLAIGVISLLIGIAFSYFPGRLFYQHQIHATQKRLVPVILALEKEHQATGTYPQKIDELLKQAHLPILTKDKVVFLSRADFFSIYFQDPNSGLLDVFIYDSNSKKWDYHLR